MLEVLISIVIMLAFIEAINYHYKCVDAVAWFIWKRQTSYGVWVAKRVLKKCAPVNRIYLSLILIELILQKRVARLKADWCPSVMYRWIGKWDG